MERHGDASAHVYTLPSSRLRAAGSQPAPTTASTTLSAGHSPVTEQVPHAATSTPSSTQPQRKYNSEHWTLVYLKRSTTGMRSLPSTPHVEQPPPTTDQAAATTSETSPATPAYLIATLLHIPTQVLYAWPIALKGASSGKCFVTEPPVPPADYANYNLDKVLSESIKVLTDVVQAWIKTSSMRESLRRRESKKQKGARKIGENEQDAIWLNDSLGLAEITQDARAKIIERSWKEQGETVSPPAASPHQSATASPSLDKGKPVQRGDPATGAASAQDPSASSSSRPGTPRIEISGPGQAASSPSSYFSGPPAVDSVDEAVNKAGMQQEAIEAEINQWMNSASLAEFTRARPEVARKSAMSGSSSASSSGTSSPVHRQRKSVTFSEQPHVPVGSSSQATSSPKMSSSISPSLSYRPPFAPNVLDLPDTDEDDGGGGGGGGDALSLPPSVLASSVVPPAAAPKSKQQIQIPRPIITSGLKGHASPPSPKAQMNPVKSPRSGKFLDITKTLSAESTRSAPPGIPDRDRDLSLTTSTTAATSPGRHRKSLSKLSQEIPADELVQRGGGGKHGGSGSSARLSPSQSFAELKTAFKSFKPHLGTKKKVSPM